MPSVPYANTARVRVHQSFNGEESVNVWHILFEAGQSLLDSATAQEIADAFEAFYSNTFAASPAGIGAIRPVYSILDSISVQDLRTVPNPLPFEFALNVPGVGSPAPVEPNDMAIVLSLRTLTSGRSGRGRVYLGPLSQVMSAGSAGFPPQINAAVRTGILDAANDLNTALAGTGTAGFRIGVLSVVDGLTRLVFEGRVDARPDTQRRRDLSSTFPVSVLPLI